MKSVLTIFILLLSVLVLNAQKPANGKYTYKLSYAEWGGKSTNNTVLVIIKDDSVTLINDGSTSGTKGAIIEQGILIKHTSGKWIMGHSPEDRNAKDLNGCDGPRIIDFRKKTITSC